MRRSLLFVLAALACCALASSPAQAQECTFCPVNGGYLSCDSACWYCSGILTPDLGCSEQAWTTCGEAAGHSANDSDGDGVGNGSDNCTCTSNSSQANCDGDAYGNACDSLNANYVYSHEQLCMVDRDTHFGYYELERHFDQVYVDSSSCGAPNTYDTYEDGNSAWCSGIDTETCCLEVLQETQWWCDRVDQDFCLGN